jgi:hypothetical protein
MTTDNHEPKKVIPIQAVPADDSEEMVLWFALGGVGHAPSGVV